MAEIRAKLNIREQPESPKEKDIELLGEQNFKRTILKLCKTRGDTNYTEAKYLFEREALERDDYYNEWISCKIGKSSVIKKT